MLPTLQSVVAAGRRPLSRTRSTTRRLAVIELAVAALVVLGGWRPSRSGWPGGRGGSSTSP
jgi:hypothetical protein